MGHQTEKPPMDPLERRLKEELRKRIPPQFAVPPLLVRVLIDYVVLGRPPGHFMYCFLANDLFGAYAHGVSESIAVLPLLVEYVYNHLPGNCWGSPEEVDTWIRIGGQYGQEMQRQKKEGG